MQIDVPEMLLGNRDLSPASKIVLMVILSEETQFLTYEKISELCGLSIKDVRSAIKLLRGEPTARRKNTTKWIRTDRVKHGGATATRFTVVHNLTKGKVYGHETTLQKGSFGGTNLTKGKVSPTPINLTKGKVCTDDNLTKGKVSQNDTYLTVKELNKFNSN